MWHSLKENGEINFYDVEWPDGTVETDIPASLLEKVKDSESINELHEKHGVENHKEGAKLSERKYKKKRKKKKGKKSKKKSYLVYPYFAGDNMFASSDSGVDIGGDGGGE